jgi:membrane protein YdbS with pleckstrin-like domain
VRAAGTAVAQRFPEEPGTLPPAGPETELWAGRTSGKHFAGRWLVWLLGNALVGALVIWITRRTDAIVLRGAVWTILILGLGSGAVVLGSVLLRVLGTRYRLTTQRLFIERGILSKTMDQTELIRVDDVRLYRPLLDRVFGLGSVAVVTTDATDRETLIEGIAEPERVSEAVRGQMRALRRKSVFVERI